MRKASQLIFLLFFLIQGFSQNRPVEWRILPIERLPVPPDKRPFFHELLCSNSGSLILSSTQGLINFQGFRINFPSQSIMANKKEQMEKVKDPHTQDGIRSMCRGKGSNFFFLTEQRRIYYMDENLITLTGWSNPPLYMPVNISKGKTISSIWADSLDLFVGMNNDSVIIIPGVANHSPSDGKMSEDGNFTSKDIMVNSKTIFISSQCDTYAFTNDSNDPGKVLIATSKGIAQLEKKSGNVKFLGVIPNDKIIITDMHCDKSGNVWFSTVGYGMGLYDAKLNEYFFYPGRSGSNQRLTINSIIKKSPIEFFVAVADSLPAIFNTVDHSFTFIYDTIFERTKNNTTDIKVNGFGNLFIVKGGALYYSNSFSESKEYAGLRLDSSAYAPFIWNIQINNRPYFEVINKTPVLSGLSQIKLKHNQNRLEFSYSLLEFWNQQEIITQWKIDGLNMDWVDPIPDPEKFKAKFIPPLSPGKYIIKLRARTGNGTWRSQESALIIVISPPFWQTWWFWSIVAVTVLGLIVFFYKRHISSIRRKERKKIVHEKEMLELEAKALRAQMNPHFVFNSLNSIKSLINKNDNEKAVGYLATFSKLIRVLFQNSNTREVSLHEELETCKLYTELEKMRFGNKVEFVFDVDETIDIKDFKVPALILQPFIENAIWHGLMPKEAGGKIIIGVKKVEGAIQCIIDDNGIGRELSIKNKPKYESTHQSKGIGLTQSRLELDKLLNEREDKIFIIDKEDEYGKSGGTKVIISFKEMGID